MGKVSRALNKADYQAGSAGSKSAPLVSAVPDYNGPAGTENKISTADAVRSSPPPAETADADGRWDERLIISTDNFSSTAESFRKLRTLILRPETGAPPHSILIVSAGAREGKSFVCANLGVRLAHGTDRQALIVDCDLRRPSIHDLFGLNNEQGLVDYLTDRNDLPSLIRKTQLPNLTILPAGVVPENPSELVAANRSIMLLTEALRTYDDRFILFDSPPLLAASETLILSQLVDKVVVVVRWGESGREEIKKVVEQIGREKIIGIVFNAFETNIIDRKVQGMGYNKYYSENYY